MSAIPQNAAPDRRLYLVKEEESEYDAGERRPKPGETAGGVRHVRIPVNVFDCPHLTHGAVRLYGRLQQHMGDEGCFPSYETLAGRMGCSERAVREYRMELEAAGVITHKRGGGARSNRYELSPDRLRDMSAESTPKPKAAKSADIGAKSAKSAVESRQNLPPMSAKSAEESDLSNQTSLIKSTPTELTTTAPRSGAAKKVPPVPELTDAAAAAILGILGIETTGEAGARIAAILAEFPAVNHRSAAACCAEWCAGKRRKVTVRTYRAWCQRERPANGANDATEAAAAGGPDQAGRPGRTPGVQGATGGTAESKASTAEWIRAQRAQLAALVAPGEGGPVPGVPVRRG